MGKWDLTCHGDEGARSMTDTRHCVADPVLDGAYVSIRDVVDHSG
ncbi:MAG: hypothetical protein ACLFVZ_08825 [Actinomycetota bacterium]